MVPEIWTTAIKKIVNIVSWENGNKETDIMAHKQYSAQYEAKIVLEVLQGEREAGEIASENQAEPQYGTQPYCPTILFLRLLRPHTERPWAVL